MKFRKKPVVIEAHKWDGNVKSFFDWINSFDDKSMSSIGMDDGSLSIGTLEGRMQASLGDWIIRGVEGEFYPCKPDIFEKTYEAVNG